MISAEEARRRTFVKIECSDLMSIIEQNIAQAVDSGFYDTKISLDNPNRQTVDAVIKELNRFGYDAKYEEAQPLPDGCSSDQWDYYSYLWIGWKTVIVTPD